VLIGVASFEDSPQEGVCFVIDLTEPKKLEQQFLRAQRMESIGTLAGGIAHDLNNILAPIMMSIDMLKLTATDPQARKILETIEVSAKRGADIVRQVLSFARGVEGERIEIELRHLLMEIKTVIQDTFPKNIRLHFSIPPETWMILGDPTQVHQILLNLCVNARDAMPHGGTLEVGVENCVLNEHDAAMNHPAKAGRYVKINVTDSGVGIPPEILEKIFEPFFTTKEASKGTGLGLSTVAAIVKSHEGMVNVSSKPGRGTTFKVYLPATEVSPEAQKNRLKAGIAPRGNGETILVVDDEVSILAITSQTLEAFGYKVMVASNGAEAMAVYVQNSEKISVVLTDTDMPVMDGPATIRALTRVNPRVKIIAASGFTTNEGQARECATVGHFLTKPYTAGTLLKMIRSLLEEDDGK
jgi:nitrogen-specific signal transduction histidine kinase/ActR/RegA family two-component response regulator